MRARLLLTAVTIIFTAACQPAGNSDSGNSKPGADRTNEVKELRALFEREWDRGLKEHPVRATYHGLRKYNDRWPDNSLEAIRKRHAHDKAVLEELRKIDRSALPEQEKLNYDLFERQLADSIEAHQYKQYLIPLNQRGGIQTANEITEVIRFRDVKAYENWLARMRKLGDYIDRTIALMETGIEEGVVPPRVIMERIPDQIETQLVESPEKSPFYKPFENFPESIAESERKRLRNAAREAIGKTVVPAYERFHAFFTDTYLPATRESVAANDFPNGEAFYKYRVRHYTTTDLTPEEIHQIGLNEVERIRGEMMKIIDEVGFEGGFDAFLEHLRTDPKFYYEDPDELLEAYRAMSKRIDPELTELFGKLPRVPYGVRPIPEASAPDTTTAYYSRPAADGSRPGWYYVNLYKPESRPKYEIPVLSVHEAVPGHHLQIALAQELEGLPKFRRYGGFTAFVEGWGLYSESLGEEMGLYEDPYDKFGQLTYEMWRAVRLVVDTGMHAKGWSRAKAIDFFKDNAAKSEHDIVNEIDRYIAWPGQALAYKIGELRIKELRRRANEKLGDDFDIREFHDKVLENGAIPLDVLERKINQWIASKKAEG